MYDYVRKTNDRFAKTVGASPSAMSSRHGSNSSTCFTCGGAEGQSCSSLNTARSFPCSAAMHARQNQAGRKGDPRSHCIRRTAFAQTLYTSLLRRCASVRAAVAPDLCGVCNTGLACQYLIMLEHVKMGREYRTRYTSHSGGSMLPAFAA